MSGPAVGAARREQTLRAFVAAFDAHRAAEDALWAWKLHQTSDTEEEPAELVAALHRSERAMIEAREKVTL